MLFSLNIDLYSVLIKIWSWSYLVVIVANLCLRDCFFWNGSRHDGQKYLVACSGHTVSIFGPHGKQCDCSLQAWRKYDSDRSGYIESNELKVSPSVPMSAIKQINAMRVLKSNSCKMQIFSCLDVYITYKQNTHCNFNASLKAAVVAGRT